MIRKSSTTSLTSRTNNVLCDETDTKMDTTSSVQGHQVTTLSSGASLLTVSPDALDELSELNHSEGNESLPYQQKMMRSRLGRRTCEATPYGHSSASLTIPDQQLNRSVLRDYQDGAGVKLEETTEILGELMKDPLFAEKGVYIPEVELHKILSGKTPEECFEKIKKAHVFINHNGCVRMATFNHKVFATWQQAIDSISDYLKIEEGTQQKENQGSGMGFEYVDVKLTDKTFFDIVFDRVDKGIVVSLLQGDIDKLKNDEDLVVSLTLGLLLNKCKLEERDNKNYFVFWEGFECSLPDDPEIAETIANLLMSYIEKLNEGDINGSCELHKNICQHMNIQAIIGDIASICL